MLSAMATSHARRSRVARRGRAHRAPSRRLAAIGAALWLAALAAPAAARVDVQSCKRAYEDQRFEEALQLCGRLAREPLSERTEVTGALEVVGMANLVLGREKPAKAAFCQLLDGDPDYRPTDPIYPQRFVAVFDAVHASGCVPPLRLEIENASRRTQAAVRLRAPGTLPTVSRIGVFYRQAGDKRWRRELAASAALVTIELPKVSLTDGEVEVFAAVLVDDDHAVARAGTLDRPLRLARLARTAVPPPSRRAPIDVPLWKRTWFWWAVAGVAATVVIVSVSVAATRSEGPGGSLGPPIQLPLRLTWR
jgi:hypothetical protein